MTSELDSTDAELFALRSEAEQIPKAARDRIFSRLEQSVPALASATVGALASSEIASVGRSNVVRLATTGKLWLVGMFALGGVVGVGTYAMLDREPESQVVYVDRIVRAPARKPIDPVTPPTPIDTTNPRTAPAKLPTNVAPKSPSTSAAQNQPEPAARNALVVPAAPAATPAVEVPNPASLGEQQALLDKARLALGKGNGHGALETLELHARRYPESMLTEEREALAIKALASVGRSAEARSKFERFEKRFSRSPLIPSLEAATGVTESNR